MAKKVQTVRLPNYGDDEINRLAQAQAAFEAMTEEQRARALRWFKCRFSKEWPSESYS